LSREGSGAEVSGIWQTYGEMRQISRYVPPILVDGLLSAIRPFSGFSGRFSDFNEALSRVRGYEDSTIVDNYEDCLRNAIANHESESTTPITDRKIRVLAALSLAIQKSNSQSLTLFDVGGGWGGIILNSATTCQR